MSKKLLTSFSTAFLTCGMLMASSEWAYTISDGKAILGGGGVDLPAIPTSMAGDLIIPETIDGYPVSAIGEYAFAGCSLLTSISIPTSIEFIGAHAFSDCSALTNILWNAGSLKAVKNNAFSGCVALKNIVVPDGVEEIGSDIFVHCHSLTNAVVPASVTNLGVYAFSYCNHLEKLTLPFIGSQRGNQGTKESVFGHIFGLKTYDGLMKVTQTYGASGTITRYIPNSLKQVSVTDETHVPYAAFENCSNLTSVVIGNSVTNIAEEVFSGCSGLQSLTLPFIGSQRGNYGPKNLDADHYWGASDAVLGHVFGSSAHPGMIRRQQSLGWNDDWVTAYFPAGLSNVEITDETIVSYGAFYGLYMLTNVTINAGVERIGGYAFRNCVGLKNVHIPNTVQKLDNAAFRGSGLETVFVPLSVTNIEIGSAGHVFEGCASLRLAYVPRLFKRKILDNDNTFANCSTDLQVIYYDENMKFFDETLRTEDNSSTNIVTVCTNANRVTFKWKCSCEPLIKGNPYDYLSFSIDGVSQSFICGETDWAELSCVVSGVGEHTITWTYQKDEEGSAGEDCGWIRNVVVAPQVMLSFAAGDATDGEPPSAIPFYADDDTVVLPEKGTLIKQNHDFAGWSDGTTIYLPNTDYPCDGTQTLTAVWAANTLSAPVITAPETYEADSATVTIAADGGATVYYTLDGSTPEADGTGCRTYQGPFEIEGSATIKAIAVKDNYFDSEVASFTVTRPTWTYGEYLNCPERMFTMGGNTEWVREKGVSADGYALRSGEVTHSQTSRLETVVYGAGTVAFHCKVDGEIVKKIVYDGLAFCVDGEQQGDLMGDADWTEKTFTVAGDGRHVLSWLYVKDEEGDGGGADCAWLDNVIWTPDDPLPPLDVTATDNDAHAIVAGLSDVRLSDKIGSTVAYTAFRKWVDGKGLSHALVKDAPNAWLSYVLDAPGLMAKPEPLASEDVVIESIAPSSTVSGTFDLIVSIAGAEIGEGARLAETLGIEGAVELNESKFSSDGLIVTLERTATGKLKATVTPEGSPTSFFLRVRVK